MVDASAYGRRFPGLAAAARAFGDADIMKNVIRGGAAGLLLGLMITAICLGVWVIGDSADGHMLAGYVVFFVGWPSSLLADPLMEVFPHFGWIGFAVPLMIFNLGIIGAMCGTLFTLLMTPEAE